MNFYVHEKEKFMTFRNISLKSAFFWDSVDTDYECKINVYGKKEGLSNEYQYEFEQEMLKHVHDLKKDLRERRVDMKETKQRGLLDFFFEE